MSKVIELIEASTTEVALSKEEARQLNQLGRDLASKSRWWGDDEPEETEATRTIIRCEPSTSKNWRISIGNSVGLIALPSIQIHVLPKIPTAHFFYLWSFSSRIPRFADTRGEMLEGANLWELVATWFVGASEQVFRHDLVRDYTEISGTLKSKRGKVKALATARNYYAGRLEFECEYEEFDIDTPLNRILKQGVRLVLSSPTKDPVLRQRAAALNARLKGVGAFYFADLRATPDRRTRHYQDAIILARHLIHAIGRNLGTGAAPAWTFLVPTPDLIEEGIREVLISRLGNQVQIDKRGRQIEGSTMTLNPDLVFDQGRKVGDVKYKLLGRDWLRSDLYQLTTFAEGYGAEGGILIGFSKGDRQKPGRIRIGDIDLFAADWPCGDDLSPDEAAQALSDQVSTWLEAVSEQINPSLAFQGERNLFGPHPTPV